MDSPGVTKIFISYARKDGLELAHRLLDNLIAESFDAWLDEHRLETGGTWTVEIERAIDNSQVVLALLSPGSYNSEICRAEQLRSLRKGKRVIPLLAVSDSDIPLYLEAKQYRDFTGANPYATEFELLLEDILGSAGVDLKNEYRATRITYVTAPPTVTNYIERPEELRALRDLVFAGRQRQPLALTALEGMGGIGKTVLAHALMRDSLVQDAFPDGVVWITIGKERTVDLLAGFREVGKALKDDLQSYETLPAAINRYKTVLAQKAVLIIVDDIWKKSDLEPFLADSERSRLLFTTRDASIARFIGAREYTANLLSLEQSRELVSAWAKLDKNRRPTQLDDLIRECGNLPLALSTMGAMLEGATPAEWDDALSLLRNADLTAVAGRLTPGQESFFRTVDVSFHSLAGEMQTRYRALAALLEEMAAPLPVLRTLWGVPEAEALRTSRHFADRSLALRVDGTGAIRLHDLQLDYVRAQHAHPQALDLIHAALRLSQHVVARDPTQFASQIAGRLLPYVQPINATQQLAGALARAAPRFTQAYWCLFAFPVVFLNREFPVRLVPRIAALKVEHTQAYVRPDPALQQFVRAVGRAAPRPWLRSLEPALYPPGMGLVHSLAGDTLSARFAVTQDGSRAVSVSYKTITVWDLKTGRELQTLSGSFGWPCWIGVSGGARRAALTFEPLLRHTTIKVWDLETGREVRTLQTNISRVISMAITDDGRQFLSPSSDNTVKVWDLETGCELHTLTGHLDEVVSVAVSGDGRWALSASKDKTVKAWDLKAGRELRTLSVEFDLIHLPRICIAMSGNGGQAVIAADKKLIVWHLETGRELRFEHGEFDASSLAVSWDGLLAVSADRRELKVWDLETGREIRTLGDNQAGAVLAISRDGDLIVSGNAGTLKVWDLKTRRELRPLTGHSMKVICVAVSGSGRRAVSVSEDAVLKVWNLETGRLLRTIFKEPSGVAISFDGRRAVSPWAQFSLQPFDDGRRFRFGMRVWNLKTGRTVRTLASHSERVKAVALSRDGRRAVTASEDRTLKLWDLNTGRELRTLTGHSGPIVSVAISDDGRRAVSASEDGELKGWDLEGGKGWDLESADTIADESADTVVDELDELQKEFRVVAVTGDGKRAVTSSHRRLELTVWDLERGSKVRTLAGHSDRVSGLSLSGDGQWVISTSLDKTLKVWRLPTGELATTYTCDAPVRCCAFAGRNRIVAGDESGRVHFLSLELDERLAP
jgi:WD40 repeat protein